MAIVNIQYIISRIHRDKFQLFDVRYRYQAIAFIVIDMESEIV
jgi:hypothetical protein